MQHTYILGLVLKQELACQAVLLWLIVVLRFLNYLADLCVSKGTAVQTIQMMVCTTVLDDFNLNVLMQIE